MTQKKPTLIKIEDKQFVVVVLEDTIDFSTETNEAYLVPENLAAEHKLFESDGFEISNELKKEMEPFKIHHIKSFYSSND